MFLDVNKPNWLKLKSSGRGPLGNRVSGSRNSSKNACAQASSGVKRVAGV